MHERDVISDEAWVQIEALLPQAEGRSRPWLEHRMVIEGIAWRFRTGSPRRDLPERFDRWAKDGTWQRILTAVQARSDQLGKLDWVVSIDSTIARVHQHDATLTRATGGSVELQDSGRGAT